MNRPLVSVILTTYNAEATIDQVVRSILGQEGAGKDFDVELIVVDDMSTDDTLNVLANLGVHVLHTGCNTGGPNRGRNIGLEACSGQAICIADHDDVWEPQRLSLTVPHLERAPIVTCGYTVYDRVSGKTDCRIADQPLVEYPDGVTFMDKLARSKTGQNTYLGSILYSAELVHVRFEEQYGVVDFDWILRLFDGKSSIEVGHSLYRRNVERSNLSLDPVYRERDLEVTLACIASYKRLHPRASRLGTRRAYGTYARYAYVTGRMPLARKYFLKAGITPLHAAYWITTFVGATWVRRRFNVFG